jgi:regulator of nucleoside diphosphate kinase
MKPKILITERDRGRLDALLSQLRADVDIRQDDIDDLAQRVEAATVIPGEDAPRSLVTMNSLVGLRDLGVNEKFSCILVYPDDPDLVRHKVSVHVPLGSGMLGARVGDTIDCQVDDRLRQLRVERVFYQPEAARDFHL